MTLNKLREPVRINMVKNDLHLLNILATGHNLIRCIETKNWERLCNKLIAFTDGYNKLIEELNKKETPIEDEIEILEAKIEELQNNPN